MPQVENWMTLPEHSFAGLPISTQLGTLEADIAIIGVHYHSPYPPASPVGSSRNPKETAADTIRRQSAIFTDHLQHYDFDFNEPLLADQDIRIIDCGDIDKNPGFPQTPEHITTALRVILDRGAVPIAIGTDEGGIIPILRAYDGRDAVCVVHIDAHIDWRDERDGVRDGYSSVMRRASEMPWVKSMAQVGLRGIGSARQKEVDDALNFGSVFIRARDIHQQGVNACLARIPAADHYIITIDADAFDTSIAPGVLFPSPGGLTFHETTDLVQGIASKGSIAGINLFEIRPERDINNLTAAIGAQLIIHCLGILARSGKWDT